MPSRAACISAGLSAVRSSCSTARSTRRALTDSLWLACPTVAGRLRTLINEVPRILRIGQHVVEPTSGNRFPVKLPFHVSRERDLFSLAVLDDLVEGAELQR